MKVRSPRRDNTVAFCSQDHSSPRLLPSNLPPNSTLVLAIELVVQRLVQREDNMARGDEELVAVTAFGHEEATGARQQEVWPGHRDGETERVGKTVTNVYIWVGGQNRWEELGTGGPGNGQLPDFDVDVW